MGVILCSLVESNEGGVISRAREVLDFVTADEYIDGIHLKVTAYCVTKRMVYLGRKFIPPLAANVTTFSNFDKTSIDVPNKYIIYNWPLAVLFTIYFNFFSK